MAENTVTLTADIDVHGMLSGIVLIREEARAAVAEELRLELWKLPTKQAERLEAYEARIAHHVDLLLAVVTKTDAEDADPAKPSQPKQDSAPAAADEDAEAAPDLADDLDDGADLF